MGKRTRVQIDVNEIFYGGIHDDATKTRIMKSHVWPVVVAIYSFTDRKLQVGPVCFGSEQYIHLLTKSGLPVACVHSDNENDKISILVTDRTVVGCELNSTNGYSNRLETNNVRYAVSKFGSNAFHDVRDALLNALNQVENGINELMRQSLDTIVDKMAGRSMSLPTIKVDSTTTTALARIAIGGEDRSTLPLETLQNMEKAYVDYLASMDFFKKTVDGATGMFTGDKWIVIDNLVGGIVVGAVSNQPMLVAYEAYKTSGVLPTYNTFSYLDYKIPLKWYKNMDAMPFDLRSDLETSLLMLKTHTNSTGWLPSTEYHDGLKMWDSIEAFSYRSYFTGLSTMFVLSK